MARPAELHRHIFQTGEAVIKFLTVHFRRALQSTFAHLHVRKETCAGAGDDAVAALRRVEDFARQNWWHYQAFLALGRLYSEKGETERANAALRHASWLDINDVESLNLIAMMRLRENRLEEACLAQRRAVARQPDVPRQHVLLSNILEKMGRLDEAHATNAQVARLQHLGQASVVPN